MNQDLIKFEGGQDEAYAFLDPNSESLTDGIGASYGILGYRGKNWNLRYRGETYYFTRHDDGTPLALLNVIIISQARTKSKSYFENWVEGATDPPICWSMNAVTPDDDVPPEQKQSPTCAVCPRNEFHISPDGKKKRDCSDYKRIAVLLPVDHTTKLLGAPLMEPVFLRVPPSSLQALGALGDQLQKRGLHFAQVVTQIAFDPTQSYPKMIFTAIAKAPPQFAEKVKELRSDPVTDRIIGILPQIGRTAPLVQIAQQPAQTGFDAGPQTLELTANPTVMPASAPQTIKVDDGPAIQLKPGQFMDATGTIRMMDPKAPAPQPAPAPASVGAAPQSQSPAAAPTVSMAPAASTQQAPAPVTEQPPPAPPQPATQDTGFGVAAVAPTPPAQSAPATPPADTGKATETDAEMDARIARLMPKS